MNQVERALREIVAVLETLGHPYALVGGLAVSARAEPRTTRDVDVAIGVAADDGDDLRALIREAHETDLTDARHAVASIEARGFHRGRDLRELLEQAIAEHGTGPRGG
jgi:hypothetical protein